MRVRQARAADADAVAAFTRETWTDLDREDYVPEVFPAWVESDGPTQRTFVADPQTGDGGIAGVVQCVLLSADEAWGQGLRVNPAYRGEGVSVDLTRAVFEFAAEAGASVCRNMVFSWNVAGLGQSRAVGYEPCTEFRWAKPEPDPAAEPRTDADLVVVGGAGNEVAGDGTKVGGSVEPDPKEAWSFWTASDACDHLQGLALDDAESWALSELTRERVVDAASDGRLLTVLDDGDESRSEDVRGFSIRVRTVDDVGEGDERRAEYAVGAWADVDAAATLLAGVARDAAAVDADLTRVLIPESVTWVSDVAAARVGVSAEPDFVMAADLTDIPV